MARYRNSQDLGVFIGARYICPTFEEGGKPIRGIFIPVDINGIEVQQDNREEGKRNASGIRAFINTQQRSCNNKYIDAVKQSLMRKGEEITLYNVPAYQICYTLPEEKRQKIRAALAKRLKLEHPEWAQQTDTQGTDLQSASQTPRNTSAPVAQGVAGYTSQQPDPFDEAFTQNNDDLPF